MNLAHKGPLRLLTGYRRVPAAFVRNGAERSINRVRYLPAAVPTSTIAENVPISLILSRDGKEKSEGSTLSEGLFAEISEEMKKIYK